MERNRLARLRDFGVKKTDIPMLAKEAVLSSKKRDPLRLDEVDYRGIFERAI